jgi:hypothetical protein
MHRIGCQVTGAQHYPGSPVLNIEMGPGDLGKAVRLARQPYQAFEPEAVSYHSMHRSLHKR